MIFSIPPAVVLAMTLAQAAPPPMISPAKAKAYAQILLREGTSLFDHGETVAALKKFEEAYQIFPSPKIWFNVAAAERALDRPVEALQAFQRFLDQAPQAPAESRRDAQQAVAALMSSLGRVNVECAIAGVDVSIDGKPAGLTPLVAPLWATPGQHRIAGSREGMAPDVQDVVVDAGSESTVILAARTPAPPIAAPPLLPAPPLAAAPVTPSLVTAVQAPAAPPPASTVERPLTRRWWFWTAVGVVVAAGVVGVVLGTRGGGTDVPGTTLGSQAFP